ncbi:hypothetical protein C161_22194 [Paenibacillus sp. FSL R5-192]|uniref:hypothetical protein n=1 Tax=Paenibacillus sp. FSL R5-192 TaxID=1226754 RepID=UPI0003E225D2|nr:hypothetical protein [Paenibacillus sp. FSL R5-192]ETT32718.1 hypothetical protein C161_22194 [Paenibacillus sp. FSL R5-192]
MDSEESKSDPAEKRCDELNALLKDEKIGLLLTLCGRESVLEIIERVEHDQLTAVDVYRDLNENMNIPPQMIFMNGAEAVLEIINGKATITQLSKPKRTFEKLRRIFRRIYWK